jgi:hypothetical protein
MKLRFLPQVFAFAAASLFIHAAEYVLPEEEKKLGFEVLFGGKDLTGWEQKGNWIIQGDALFRSDKGGSIRYAAKPVPNDFELRFDWKISERGNSGVYYRPGQYEYQILHNQGHGDGRNPRTSAASLYFCMPPAKDVTRSVGEWNSGRIVCKGTVVQHWLNGEKVVDFDYANPKWERQVELLRIRGGDLAARGAFLSLQDHGDLVWYRNIRLRTVAESEVVRSENIDPAPVPDEMLEKERKYMESRLKQASEKK